MVSLHEDLKIFLYKQGVMLLRPDQADKGSLQVINTGSGISTLHNLPFNVYVKNHDHQIQYGNFPVLKTLDYTSMKDILGKTIFDRIDKDFAHQIYKNNNNVIYQERPFILDEEGIKIKDGTHINSLSIKVPWYSEDGKLAGILGFGLIANRDAYAQAINQLLSMKLFPAYSSKQFKTAGKFYKSHYFTSIELNILHLSARGKTAKDTAAMLSLSKRTVEHYIENIKQKLNVKTKSAMIEIFLNKYKNK